MHTHSLLVAFVAFFSFVVAEVDRPKFYFPRQVKRRVFFNDSYPRTTPAIAKPQTSQPETLYFTTTKRSSDSETYGKNSKTRDNTVYEGSDPGNPSTEPTTTIIVSSTVYLDTGLPINAPGSSLGITSSSSIGPASTKPGSSPSAGPVSDAIPPSIAAAKTSVSGTYPGTTAGFPPQIVLPTVLTSLPKILPTSITLPLSTSTGGITFGPGGVLLDTSVPPNNPYVTPTSSTPWAQTDTTITQPTLNPSTVGQGILPTNLPSIVPSGGLPLTNVLSNIASSESGPATTYPSSALSVLPTGSLPALPISVVPTYPSSALSVLPTGSLPALPISVVPTYPSSALSVLPTGSLLAVPIPIVPTYPSSALSALPTGSLPALPISVAPTYPSSALSGLSTGSLPALPISVDLTHAISVLPTGSLPAPVLVPTYPSSALSALSTASLPALSISVVPTYSSSALPTASLPVIAPVTSDQGSQTVSPTGYSTPSVIVSTIETSSAANTGDYVITGVSSTASSDSTASAMSDFTTVLPSSSLSISSGSNGTAILVTPTVSPTASKEAPEYTSASVSASVAPPTVPTSIVPTGTISIPPQNWLPTTVILEPSPTASGGYGSGIPTNLPQIITPPRVVPATRPDQTDIQIGFLYGFNYPFVVANGMCASQIFELLPLGLVYALNINISDITMQSLRPYDTQATLGYITTLALCSIPTNMVQKLQLQIRTPLSPVYQQQTQLQTDFMALINPAIPLIPGGTTYGGSPSGTNSASTPTASSGNGDGGIFNTSPQNSSGAKGPTIVIACGTVVAASAYGAAMFFVARRYKRRKSGHRRVSSIGSPEMRHSGSPFMGGALMAGGRGTPGDGRDSRGSGRSAGNSARTAQISAPMMAENSLGWN